jgi:dienelactone hydrolase
MGILLGSVFLGVAAAAGLADAAGPRVLPDDKLPADQRLQPLKDLDGYFPFTPPSSREAWEQRSEQVKRQMLVALGLWPMPTKTPLNPVIHGRIEQADYTVEKAYFESFPGFFVTGSLFRPKGKSEKCPGVLCPHGHWPNGRFYDAEVQNVRKQIVRGAERFEDSGRSPLQARCVQLARMGCVVFHYDMIGYADSIQISQGLAHGFSKQRPEMNTAENWGLFSPQAESHLQSVMGLQSWNSIRALDFLTELPDVDAGRIACTGASGGGTQTFVLSALDPRVRVSIPCVMVSTAMQGGCTCENACLLRIGTGNVEFAALFAPKPLCLLSANDWTREMATKGFPQLQDLYKLLGVEKSVHHDPLIHFDHNYNYVSRATMYQWVNQHFKLGLPAPVVEEDYPRLTPEQLTVWDDAHPKPQGGDEFERKLLCGWHEDTQKQLAALMPQDEASGKRFREVVGGAVDVLVGQRLPAAEDIAFEQVSASEDERIRTMAGLLRNKTLGSELPLVVLEPKTGGNRVAVWLHRDGKAGLFQEDGKPRPPISRLLDAGVAVMGVDLVYQGEFLAHGTPLEKAPRVQNPREAAAYSFGYNPTVFAQRVHDVLTAIAFARTRKETQAVCLVGLDGAGPWAAAALAQAGATVNQAATDLGGFRFGNVPDIYSLDFLPGGARYFDVPGMVALAAPTPLWLADAGKAAPDVVAAAYRASGHESALTVQTEAEPPQEDAAVAWLLK